MMRGSPGIVLSWEPTVVPLAAMLFTSLAKGVMTEMTSKPIVAAAIVQRLPAAMKSYGGIRQRVSQAMSLVMMEIRTSWMAVITNVIDVAMVCWGILKAVMTVTILLMTVVQTVPSIVVGTEY